MFTLTKNSHPGYVMSFENEAQVEDYLQTILCHVCLSESGASLQGLLASDCGSEYAVDRADEGSTCKTGETYE